MGKNDLKGNKRNNHNYNKHHAISYEHCLI